LSPSSGPHAVPLAGNKYDPPAVNTNNVIRVVVLTGGPELAGQVVDFMERLEQDPRIVLSGVFSESPVRGFSGMLGDLWKRRGLLALPLVLQIIWRAALLHAASPRKARRRHRTRERLRTRTHYVNNFHDEALLSTVRAIEPDLGLVYGGPIIKPELFEIPRLGCLGIHHGKLPEYRGKKTTFWALHNGEKEVGVAIQRIGRSLDRGEILMQAIVLVGKRPVPFVVKDLEKVGLDLYVRAVLAVRDRTARYTDQPGSDGRLYKDPGLLDILRYWFRYCTRVTGR
jgi:folate-dependent phosphoribosylglycinamide formyltransferase PurN